MHTLSKVLQEPTPTTPILEPHIPPRLPEQQPQALMPLRQELPLRALRITHSITASITPCTESRPLELRELPQLAPLTHTQLLLERSQPLIIPRHPDADVVNFWGVTKRSDKLRLTLV